LRPRPPLMSPVQGRTADMIYGVNGQRAHGEFFTHLIHEVGWTEGLPIAEFQVVQAARDTLRFDLAAARMPPPIESRGHEADPGLPRSDAGRVPSRRPRRPGRSGKRRFTLRLWNPDEEHQRRESRSVYLTRTAPAYPDAAPFHPTRSTRVPVRGRGAIAEQPNPAYAGIRQLLRLAGLDAGRYGTPQWNPLGTLVRPGDRVLLNRISSTIDIRGLPTAGSPCSLTAAHPCRPRLRRDRARW